MDYINLGVNPSKIIMGVPWYGYDYPCEGTSDNQTVTCHLPLVPFRGVNCSDAAGSEIAYSDIMNLLADTDANNVTT
jgi:di-N-acetylchitobiase